MNISTISNAAISHVEAAFHHVFSDAGPKKHQCPRLNWIANAATSLVLCKQVSVLPFFVRSMSLNTDMNVILSSKDSGVSPFARVEAPGNTCQMKLHFSGCQIYF